MIALLREFVEYIGNFNPLSKRIAKLTYLILFLLSLMALYFAITAGNRHDYYYGFEAFGIIMENFRSVAGIGFLSALIIEPAYRKQFGKAD